MRIDIVDVSQHGGNFSHFWKNSVPYSLSKLSKMIQFLIDSVIYKHEIEVAWDEANIIDEESSAEKNEKNF